MIIFSYRMMRAGGTENLIVKLASQIRKKEKEVYCVCEVCYDDLKALLIENDVMVDVIPWIGLDDYIAGIDKNKEVLIITFEWNTFLSFYNNDRKNKKTLLYAVHPECIRSEWLNKDTDYYHKDLRVYDKAETVKYINNLIKINKIAVMDEVVKEETERFFHCDFNFNILRISVDILDDWEKIKVQNKARYKTKTIIAASRAEFPFKGYLIGLIKWFEEFYWKTGKLEIICYGDGYNEVEELYNQLPPKCKEKVCLNGKMSYEQLREKIDKAYVFVGMGTSVIDAAEMGLMCIPIKPYEYKLMVNERFDENPFSVCAADIKPYKDFTNVMFEILNMDYETFNILSKKTHDAVVQIYDTEKIVDIMMNTLKYCADDLYDNKNDLSNVASLDSFKTICEKISTKKRTRKIAIYGAGVGGRDIFLQLKNLGYKADCFIDKQAQANSMVYSVPVYDTSILNKDKLFVVVSLKKYHKEILDLLESQKYLRGEDYCYPYVDLDSISALNN